MPLVDLLNTYSLTDILLVLILVVVGGISLIKTGIEVNSWLRKIFAKEHITRAEEQKLNTRLTGIDTEIVELKNNQNEIMESLDFFSDSLQILVDSDKDAIKAYITDKHHEYMKEGWIDDYHLDCIEKRYLHYKRGGGNSFVDHLMEELRLLPTNAPAK